LDASAVTKLVISEAETAALRERVHGRSLVSSRVAVVEVTKAVARSNPTADPQPILARLAFVELDAELARVAAATGSAMLRALDAIHLASAQRLGSEIAAFVTYDDRQAAAAKLLGLAVEAPGQDRVPG
jgi:predicted nucleic acid-binding protein